MSWGSLIREQTSKPLGGVQRAGSGKDLGDAWEKKSWELVSTSLFLYFLMF